MSKVAMPLICLAPTFIHIVLNEPITSQLLLNIVKFYVDFTGEEDRVFLAHHNYTYTTSSYVHQTTVFMVPLLPALLKSDVKALPW